jgi:hypothetical protein
MEFNSNDFKRLQYNVYELPDNKKVLDTWPELSRYSEFTSKELTGISRDKVMRYIILAYDKRTPLLSQKNLSLRKKLAGELAGFEKNDKGVFTDSVQAVLKNENKAVTRMVIRYVRIQSDMRFTLLVSGMETYYENMVRITSGGEKDKDVLDSAEKSKLFEQSKKLSDELEKLSDEVFNNDTELMGEADEVAQEEDGLILSYPEWIAKQKEKKVEGQANIGS